MNEINNELEEIEVFILECLDKRNALDHQIGTIENKVLVNGKAWSEGMLRHLYSQRLELTDNIRYMMIRYQTLTGQEYGD